MWVKKPKRIKVEQQDRDGRAVRARTLDGGAIVKLQRALVCICAVRWFSADAACRGGKLRRRNVRAKMFKLKGNSHRSRTPHEAQNYFVTYELYEL